MKKLITGITFFLAGTIYLITVYIHSGEIMRTLGGWTTPPGKFLYGISEMGYRFPFVLGIILSIAGIVFMLWGTFEKKQDSSAGRVDS